jgi:hypothetical protein
LKRYSHHIQKTCPPLAVLKLDIVVALGPWALEFDAAVEAMELHQCLSF